MNTTCQCGCPRYQCCCHYNPAHVIEEAKQAGIETTPFQEMGAMEFYMKKACELYEYLMVTQPIAYNDASAKSRYDELIMWRSKMATSLDGMVARDNNANMQILMNAYDIYVEKCSQLLMLRNDPAFKNTVFPMSYDITDNVSYISNRF